MSDPQFVFKKLDSQVDDIKGLYANIEVLTTRVESQNKFLYDMMSMDKAWVPSKCHCDRHTFVKQDEKYMLNQQN